jgi:hypothetical protein
MVSPPITADPNEIRLLSGIQPAEPLQARL